MIDFNYLLRLRKTMDGLRGVKNMILPHLIVDCIDHVVFLYKEYDDDPCVLLRINTLMQTIRMLESTYTRYDYELERLLDKELQYSDDTNESDIDSSDFEEPNF